MSAAFDRLNTGYWNAGLKAGGNPGGLSGPGAMRENWPLVLADIAAVIAEAAASAAAAATSASAATIAPASRSTSISNRTIPAIDGSVTFTLVEADRVYSPGQSAVCSVTGDAETQFSGVITAWDSVTKALTVKAKHVAGVGTFNTWVIALTAPIDATLTGRVTALEAADAAAAEKALFHNDEEF
jgi:hypothetical protein